MCNVYVPTYKGIGGLTSTVLGTGISSKGLEHGRCSAHCRRRSRAVARQAVLLEDRVATLGALVERRSTQLAGKREDGSARSAILATLAVATESATTVRHTLSAARASLVLDGLTTVRALVNGVLLQPTAVREFVRANNRLACAVTAVAS